MTQRKEGWQWKWFVSVPPPRKCLPLAWAARGNECVHLQTWSKIAFSDSVDHWCHNPTRRVVSNWTRRHAQFQNHHQRWHQLKFHVILADEIEREDEGKLSKQKWRKWITGCWGMKNMSELCIVAIVNGCAMQSSSRVAHLIVILIMNWTECFAKCFPFTRECTTRLATSRWVRKKLKLCTETRRPGYQEQYSTRQVNTSGFDWEWEQNGSKVRRIITPKHDRLTLKSHRDLVLTQLKTVPVGILLK